MNNEYITFIYDSTLRPSIYLFKEVLKEILMGRFTKPFRQSFYAIVEMLRKGFRDPLNSRRRREAFDKLTQVWAEELGAMSYSSEVKMLDLLLQLSALENRRLLGECESLFDGLEKRIEAIE